MLNVETFFKSLSNCGIRFYTGVPDSLLKNFCSYILSTVDDNKHIIAANEGNAVALAAGSYLATGEIPLVYMQNSGLGNGVNPLVSLTHAQVYSIPILLLIGWRGEPDVHDEPQHRVQGEITTQLLDILQIPYQILPDDDDAATEAVVLAHKKASTMNIPVALIVKKNTFDVVEAPKQTLNEHQLSREEAIDIIINKLPDAFFVGTTGKLSRELFELREKNNEGHSQDFLTVGSMGHASSIALGVALEMPQKNICCLDGDGAVIMHMGSMAVIGQKKPVNFCHILLNNGVHDSVGGQPTAGKSLDFKKIADACGYMLSFSVTSHQELEDALNQFINKPTLMFVEVKIKSGSRSDLGRPTRTPVENKNDFIELLRKK